MCLELNKNAIAKIAEKDIKVWKCLLINWDRTLCTPYKLSDINLGETYEAEIFITEDNEITRGLHSFKTLRGCQSEFSLWKRSLSFNKVIVVCLIPKGSVYYEGKFNKLVSIASNKLTYVKLL